MTVEKMNTCGFSIEIFTQIQCLIKFEKRLFLTKTKTTSIEKKPTMQITHLSYAHYQFSTLIALPKRIITIIHKIVTI